MLNIIESDKGFYIGDPCYVLSENVYSNIWGDRYCFKDGKITDPTSGFSFAAEGTAYGDGSYFDEDNNEYSVDSGTLALIPLELVEKHKNLYLGRTIEEQGEASMDVTQGKFRFDMPSGLIIEIDTDYM